MPLHELTCAACHVRYTILVGMTAAADSPACPRCGAESGVRRISRFAKGRIAADAPADNPSDPASMRAWADAVQRETGERLGDEFDEYLEASESGEKTGTE
ncbi:MAG: putative cytochrome c family protein [Capsulimonas sp.]|jgi:putative FmdB family regulatory protein|nr:putative cytochrome c family protein [Capsulimonas sp.]